MTADPIATTGMDGGKAPVLIQLCNVTKSYCRGAQTVPVLTGITFDIDAGEFLALMGQIGRAHV